ncbi:MAG: hypothetical protein C0412_21040, partial [Flavobacterium sp.]|nr:hypothetical protein [Flavobacterium sp.]
MLNKLKIKKILNQVLEYAKKAGADQTEVLFFGGKNSLTRFANSQIHQNVTKENVEISIRTILGKKIGVA